MNKLMSGCVRLFTFLGKMGFSSGMSQGAELKFTENMIPEAITAFANFVNQEHDHKAAQLGQFIYTNGSVSSTFQGNRIPNLPLA